MKISILASQNGEKALYLHDFFKEGNRVEIDSLLTDFPDSPMALNLRSQGIEVKDINTYNDLETIALQLKERGVELLVVDDYAGPLPEAIVREFDNAVVYPATAEGAPLEVIEAAELLNKKSPPTPSVKKSDNDREPTLEEEWAQVLKIDYDPEEVESPEMESPEMESREEEPPLYPNPTPPEYQPNPQPQPQPQLQPQPQPRLEEPMPKTYLVWSVIITLVCCLIPGIVAIVYSASVSSKYYAGDVEGAKRASRNAQIWCIVSIVTGIVWATLYLPLSLFLG